MSILVTKLPPINAAHPPRTSFEYQKNSIEENVKQSAERCLNSQMFFFQKIRLDNVVAFTATVLGFAFFAIPGVLTAAGVFTAYKAASYFIGPLEIRQVGHYSFCPTTVSPNLQDPNKQYIYDRLIAGQKLTKPVQITKYELQNGHALDVLSLFEKPKKDVQVRSGLFAFDRSTKKTMHWTPDFADPILFGFSHGPLYAQEEVLVSEHPSLSHLRTALEKEPALRTLDGDQVALLPGVERFGMMDTVRKLSNGKTIYGNQLAQASKWDIDACLKRFNAPRESNIFALAAPHIGSHLANKPYEHRHLKQLFHRAFLAFKAIQDVYGSSKEIVIHTGNWGAGAFGNGPKTVALIQLAAARLAGVRLIYYPMDSKADFTRASQLLDQIEAQHSQFTVGEFLNNLTKNSVAYGLRYSVSNGT